MAGKIKGFFTMLTDGRTRTVFVFTVILLSVGIVFGFLKLRGHKGGPGAAAGASAVSSAPGNIQSIPGGFGTPESAEYARLQSQQNANEASRAMHSGGSAIPTLISSSSLGTEGFQSQQKITTPKEVPASCVAPGTQVYSSNCQVVGTLSPDGSIRSAGGQGAAPIQPGRFAFGQGAMSETVIGKVGKDGFVRNAQSQVVGIAGSEGTVRNLAGTEVGRISVNSEGNPVFDPADTVLGSVNGSGDAVSVPSPQGKQIIGKLRSNSDVMNSQGQIVGRAADYVPGQLIYGPEGKVTGRVGDNAQARNTQGQVVGRVGPHGEVFNAQGQPAGRVGNAVPGQLVYGPNGKPIGRIGPNGEILNAQGQVIGHIGPNGEILNAQGQVIGSVSPGGLKSGGPLYDAYGNMIGRVGTDGKFLAAAGGERVAAPGAKTTAGGGVPGTAGTGGNAALQAIMERQAAQINAAETQQIKQQMQAAMLSQSGQLVSAWAPPSQQYVAGSEPKKNEGGGLGGAGGGAEGSNAFEVGNGPVIKAGSIMFAVLDTSVNSDEPGPILATITSGGLKGGKLIGALTNQGKKVLIRFTTLSYPTYSNSLSLTAVAIDPTTARTGISDYTNNHYLLRYGTLFAASFLQGYAQAISQSGSTVISNGFNTQKNLPSLSPSGEMVVALGNVGTQYSSVLTGFQNTPPTVHVYSGTGLGVLVLNDLKLPAPPVE
ncbi:MAG: hypothetical protein HY939_05130 [Gammaproteobacteria bacterium]|nr:hypothetical protein [Gammaproteobacteria bacterium]